MIAITYAAVQPHGALRISLSKFVMSHQKQTRQPDWGMKNLERISPIRVLPRTFSQYNFPIRKTAVGNANHVEGFTLSGRARGCPGRSDNRPAA